jgi:hypothetical protein
MSWMEMQDYYDSLGIKTNIQVQSITSWYDEINRSVNLAPNIKRRS